MRRNHLKNLGLIICVAACAVALMSTIGCANPTTANLNKDAVTTTNQPSNVARFTDSDWSASFPAVTPTHSMIDADGVHVQTGGIGTAMNAAGIVGLWSGKDVDMEGVLITHDPGTKQLSFKADKVHAGVSSVVQSYTEQVQQVMEATKEMTRIEADRYIKGLEATGQITSDLANVLLEFYSPRLPLGGGG